MNKAQEALDLVNDLGPNLGTPDIVLLLVESAIIQAAGRIDGYVDDVAALLDAGATDTAIVGRVAPLLAKQDSDILATLLTYALLQLALARKVYYATTF